MKSIAGVFALALLAGLAAASRAEGALVVTNGDFESNPISGNNYDNNILLWNESNLAGLFHEFVNHDTANMDAGSTNVLSFASLATYPGFVYQNLGNRSASDGLLSVTFGAYKSQLRNWTDATILSFDFYAGAYVPGTDGNGAATDLVGKGLTLLGTITASRTDLGFSAVTANKEFNPSFTPPTKINLSSVAVGTPIWMRISAAAVDGGNRQVSIDNVSVSVIALESAPEPSSCLFVAASALGLAFSYRRRRAMCC